MKREAPQRYAGGLFYFIFAPKIEELNIIIEFYGITVWNRRAT